MNFKEIYKEANDEIKGDRKIIDSLFDGSAEKVREKKKSPARIVYAFGSLAAAAVILFAVTYMPDFSKKPVDETAPPKVESESVKEEANAEKEPERDTEKTAKSESADIVKKTEVTDEKKNIAVFHENKINEAVNSAEPEALEDSNEALPPVGEEAVNEPAVTFSMSAVPETVTDNSESFAEKSTDSLSVDGSNESKEDAGADMRTKTSGASSGGGGGANSASANSLPNVNEIPTDEFFTLIGFNKEKLSLSGYSLTMPETASVIEDEEGNVLSASAEFYLSAEASHISVTLSSGSDVTEKTVTAFSGGVSAYADNGKISAYISALNAEEQIISDYMDQLMKED